MVQSCGGSRYTYNSSQKKKIWPISTQLTLNSFFMFYHLEVSDCNTSHINVYCMWVCGTYAVMPPECGCG